MLTRPYACYRLSSRRFEKATGRRMAAPGGAPIASWQTMDESSDTLDAEDAPAPDDRREEREELSRQRVAQAIAIVAVVLASVPALPLAVRHHPALIAPFMLVPLGLLVS